MNNVSTANSGAVPREKLARAVLLCKRFINKTGIQNDKSLKIKRDLLKKFTGKTIDDFNTLKIKELNQNIQNTLRLNTLMQRRYCLAWTSSKTVPNDSHIILLDSPIDLKGKTG